MAERLRYAGFAEEATYAEDPAPAAVFHIDIASATLDPPTDQTMVYGGGRGRAPRTTRPGFYSPSGNVAYAIDVNTLGWFLKWALGEYVFTAGQVGPPQEPNIHELYGGNEVLLPSFASRLGKDVFEHVFSGCVVNSLELVIEDEFAMLTMDIMGAKDSSDTIKTVDVLILPDKFPLAFHDFTVSIGGTDKSAKVKSLTLTINNNQDAEAGRGFGQRYPYRVIAGQREVQAEMNLFFEDTEELERFWGTATGPSDSGQTEFALVFTADAGLGMDDQPLSIEINLPRCVYSEVQTQPEGRDELVQAVTALAYQKDAVMLNDGVTEVSTDVLVTILNNEAEMV